MNDKLFFSAKEDDLVLFSDQIEARIHYLKLNKFLNGIVVYKENIHKLRGRLSQEQRDETDMRENRFLIRKMVIWYELLQRLKKKSAVGKGAEACDVVCSRINIFEQPL